MEVMPPKFIGILNGARHPLGTDQSLLSMGYKCPIVSGEMCLHSKVRTPSPLSSLHSKPVKGLL